MSVFSALRLLDQGIAAVGIAHSVLAAVAANALGRLSLAIVTGPSAYWLPLAAATAVAGGAAGTVLLLGFGG